jgi:hypothetical protein
MSEQLDLIYLPELSMSFSSLKKHLSELYNIQIQKEMSDSKKVRELYDKAYHLFNNYIGNNGKLDYSDKEYGYLVDELEDVEVGYFKDESVDSDYAKRLRDEGFTMTEQEAIDTLQHRIESIEEEVGPVQYAKGGGIPNNYEGKTPEQVWNEWTLEQREHFVSDHYKEWNGSWSEDKKNLPKLSYAKVISRVPNFESALIRHISRGQYAKGGGVASQSIKDWYTNNYPTDDLGEELNEITFEDLWNTDNTDNIYEVMGVGDSVIRERLFERLSEIYGVSYDDVYDKLFVSKYADGGGVDGFNALDLPIKYKLYDEKGNIIHTTTSFNGACSKSFRENLKVIATDKSGNSRVISEIKYAEGGSVGEFYEGQSIYIKPIVYSEELKKALPNYNNYSNKELVIEKIKYDTPFKRAEAFVRETGEKVPFDIFLNNQNVKQYANGGGVGEYDSDGYSYEIFYSLDNPEILVKKEEGRLGRYAVFVGGIMRSSHPDLKSAIGQADWMHNFMLKNQYANGGGIEKFASGAKFTNAVNHLKDFIRQYPYIWTKNGKEYVPIEGWQYAALLMGYSARVTSVEQMGAGYMAKADVVDSRGNVVCSGFGYVDTTEAKWANKPVYQLIGFAQTRAVSRALRNCLSWMVKAAGFSTTPAEEMYGITPEKRGGGMKSKPFMPPAAPQEPDFIFDEPKYKAPMAPPVPSAPVMPEDMGGLDTQQIEDTLREMNAKAKANNIVIVSPEFMDEIKNALLGTNTDLHMSMLNRAINYMDNNNIVLQTPRYMSKLRKIASQKPF